MGDVERSAEKPAIYVGMTSPPGYGRRGVAWRERELQDGIEITDPPGFFIFRPDDEPATTYFVHRDDLVPVPRG